MEFHSELPEGDTLMVASIAGVNAGLSAFTMESLDDLKHQHTREVMNTQEHYSYLYQANQYIPMHSSPLHSTKLT